MAQEARRSGLFEDAKSGGIEDTNMISVGYTVQGSVLGNNSWMGGVRAFLRCGFPGVNGV